MTRRALATTQVGESAEEKMEAGEEGAESLIVYFGTIDRYLPREEEDRDKQNHSS